MRFTDDGSALVPFDDGDLHDNSFVSGGPEAQTSNLTQLGGPSGSEVDQTNAFFSVKFALNDKIDLFADLLAGSVESNGTSYVSGATWSSIWSASMARCA